MQSITALGCAILLLAVALVVGIICRTDGWRIWPRKTVLFSVATAVLALAVAQQAWSLYQSFIRKGLPPYATYRDVYTMNMTAANQLDVAAGTFGMWSVALVVATLVLLSASASQIVKSLRIRRQTSRKVIHTIGLPAEQPSE